MNNQLPSPSHEQLDIINNISNYNLIIDAIAGSGKTTTNLQIAQYYSDKKILLLTYNSRLKSEGRIKVLNYNIKNLEIHSYHSYCVKYYDKYCYTDDNLLNMINNNNKKLSDNYYDIIILDEAQDICPLYYKLILKIIKDINNNNIQICILGDKYQSIYDFNQADNRYIILADKLFTINSYEWKKMNLSYSFRLTKPISVFINKCILGYNRINNEKKGSLPRYIICDTFGEKFGTSNRCYEEVMYYLNRGYLYEDIFILAPSVKTDSSPIRQLANKISSCKIPIYVPNSDEEKIDQDIIEGKLVFSTFHQVKGLERKVVIVFNIDDSYFKYYKINHNPCICPNEIYVVLTRAQEQLTCFHHYKNDFMAFIKKDILSNYCYFEQNDYLKVCKNNHLKNVKTPVTTLTKHLSIDIINNALSYIDYNIINNKSSLINIPIKTLQNNLYENVSDITGTAIPAYFEYINSKKITIYDKLIKNNTDIVTVCDNNCDFIDSDNEEIIYDLKNIDINNIQINELLYIANRWNSYVSGYIYKINQISDYNWLSNDNINIAIDRLQKYISSNSDFEIELKTENKIELGNRKLIGYIDCIDNKNIWEFKCVNKLDKEHILQLACYMYLFLDRIDEINTISISKKNRLLSKLINEQSKCKTDKKKSEKQIEIDTLMQSNILVSLENYSFKLMNIFSDEIIEIKSNKNNLKKMMEYLINKKFYNSKKNTDAEFLELNKKIYDTMYS